MRTSEWISTGFLSLFILLAVVRSLPLRNRIRIISLGFAGLALVWFGLHQPQFRDWIPVILLLIVYWQGGGFFSEPNEKLQKYLENFEKKFSLLTWLEPHDYWEIAYFFCYPMVPAAVLTLYLLNRTAQLDFFWTIVLPPTMMCHVIVSFYQSQPPWKTHSIPIERLSRRINSLVIRHASIQINTFPSAHVASSIAIAFAMLKLHLPAGLFFLFFAINITIATVVGRYHYTADAVWGILIALFWILLAW